MLTLLVFLLAVYGLANALLLKMGQWVLGTEDGRRGPGRIPYVGDVFYCPPCASFWIGMACSVWIVSPAEQIVPVWWKAMLLDGLAASAASWVLHAATEAMVSRPGGPVAGE